MNVYPALKSKMGNWDYYVVKMSARELDESVKFAHEIYDDRTLDDAIQRILNTSRVNKEIVQYLKRQPDRFFSSLVIAAIDGNPNFYGVEIADDERFDIFRNNVRLQESFGVLVFDGTQKYYALDGQHRLAGIKTLMDRNNPLSDGAPEGFENDDFSVIIVVNSEEDTKETFLQKYRRLFSNLNRYAKPMDPATNIIMDEDDTFAILTRRLIGELNFLSWGGDRQRESERIKTTKGKNLRSNDPYFTSIETLYKMNIELLNSRSRENRGWGTSEEETEKLSDFMRYRPSDEYIDALFEELQLYWECLLEELPILSNDPRLMRDHTADENVEDTDASDSLVFWPIGQEMLASIVRQALDFRQEDPDHPNEESVKNALSGIGSLQWNLHTPPWRYFLLTHDTNDKKWKMRNEERNEVVRIGQRIQQWIVGLDQLSEGEIEELKNEWSAKLIPAQEQSEIKNLWNIVVSQKENIQ